MFVSFHISGQILSSRVINKEGSPIKNVTVINITRLSTDRTDNDGNFSVKAEYGDSLLICTFKDKMIYVCEEKVQDIVLENFWSPYKLLKIDEKVIDQINMLYLSEKYYECIRYCSSCLNFRTSIATERHPYRDWERKKMFFENSDIESVAKVLYLGCISAYKYSLSHSYMPLEGLQWCRAYISFYDDYLNEKIPDDSWSAEMMCQYITFGKWANNVIACGHHFLRVYDGNDRWVNQSHKWFVKKQDRFLNILYKKIVNRLSDFSEYPFLQYDISTIVFNHNLQNRDYKFFQDNFSQRLNATTKLIQESYLTNQNIYVVHEALSTLTSTLTNSVIDNDLCKKIGNDFEGFCMEQLIKLQDISYYLNGSPKYSLTTNYNLGDIQNHLQDGDCALIHFEAPAKGYYDPYNLGTRFRNYALVLTKNQERPVVWRRGYINDSIVNDISYLKEFYPNVKRFFYVGTPRMSFIDVAGNDSSIVRLHSLSQLLNNKDIVLTNKEVTFIGDIDYGKVPMPSASNPKPKGKNKEEKKFNRLSGPAEELMQIETLFNNVRPICGDSVTRSIVMNEISRSKGIVHISTHGYINNNFDEEISFEDLILKRNYMDNSFFVLAGYNDNPRSPMTHLSGADVLNMKKIDSSVVFLDACLSGKGSVGAAGSVSMAEAFHLIGAKNVICYLEPIDDDIATDFSNKFYIELSKGASCHNAFFRAKNSIKKDLKVVLWE